MNMDQAQKVMTDTRDIFSQYNKALGKKQGLKSSNKKYMEDDHASGVIGKIISEEKVEIRNKNADAARDIIRKMDSKSYTKTAETIIIKTRIAFRAGNCFQMACVSAYLAKNVSKTNSSVYIAHMTDFDHAFCVVISGKSSPAMLEFKSFDGIAKLDGVIVIDPWLNVFSLAKDYLELAAKKFNRWTSRGKRILVIGTDEREHWLVPNGEYKENFMKSGIRLSSFN